ncbi:hypothetical protein EVAR_59840_1 [Eumeta japonica]|uniref:Uncharacterized protein n=1 Tax=Eumeta variegata TaxID=151549 RepID=A0A4C1YZ05_EUMVA|nr:hypothetical protein EVAR_59840_1 [Eumeta japonica]
MFRGLLGRSGGGSVDKSVASHPIGIGLNHGHGLYYRSNKRQEKWQRASQVQKKPETRNVNELTCDRFAARGDGDAAALRPSTGLWSDNRAGSLEAPSLDPEIESWSKYISGQFQQTQMFLYYISFESMWPREAPPAAPPTRAFLCYFWNKLRVMRLRTAFGSEAYIVV